MLEGYGLTETTAALTVNLPDAQRIGTVGRPLPGTSVRIADDGELLFRGGQVLRATGTTRGPLPRSSTTAGSTPATSARSTTTGFVRITGRKKEILVTAGGKNVAPAVLEDQIRAHGLVSQCMVVGDGRPFVAALVTLDPEAFQSWAERHGKTGSLQDLTSDPELLAEIQTAIDEANRGLPSRGHPQVRHPGRRLDRGDRRADADASSSSAT